MKNKTKYPIKYAILKLKEAGGYLTNYEDIVRGNIVTKCYVIESSIKYYSNGSRKSFYKVVFPFTDLKILKTSLLNNRKFIGEEKPISYKVNGEPFSVETVFDLFDTYEDAKVKAQELNEEMRQKLCLEVPYNITDKRFKPTLVEYEQKFFEQLAVCQLFEKISLLNTKDMDVTQKIDDELQLVKEKKDKKSL